MHCIDMHSPTAYLLYTGAIVYLVEKPTQTNMGLSGRHIISVLKTT